MVRTYSRNEFYELVWSKPMTQLAKEFGLSDVALHKICRKHEIPNPPPGWWAKKVAGKDVQRKPLCRAKTDGPTQVTIAAGELKQEPPTVAAARESARVASSACLADSVVPSNAVVARTVAKLRKAKPSDPKGLLAVGGPGLIPVEAAPTSVDRVERVLLAIASACEAIGIKLASGEVAAEFHYEGEAIPFLLIETVRREKHVITDKEKAEEEAWRKKQQRFGRANEWDLAFGSSRPRPPEWDYHPTGQLSFELEQAYLLGGGPRRTFRDAKVQRLEDMASDIAVGIAVMVAARKEDRLRREEERQRRAEEKQRRDLAARARHVQERRGKALDALLGELEALERLRRFVSVLETQSDDAEGRVGELLAFARQRLAHQETALSPPSLRERFETTRTFGDDDDHDFRPSPY